MKWHIDEMMTREKRMREILVSRFPQADFGLENESSQHAVPSGAETHFKLLIVDDEFVGVNRVERSRLVQKLFLEEFESGLHALSIRALTREEADQGAKEGFVSPSCMSQRKQ